VTRSSWLGAFAAVLLLVPAVSAGAAPTDLDGSFGSGGVTTTPVTQGPTQLDAFAGDVVSQSDGKLVVVGSRVRTGPTTFDWLVGRYSADGAPDTSFNGTGRAVFVESGSTTGATAAAIDGSGNIYFTGDHSAGSSSPVEVYKVTDTGGATTFGGSGIALINITGSTRTIGQALAIQPDGKILVSGQAFVGGHETPFLARFNTDGSPDSSFSAGGALYPIPPSACDDIPFPDCTQGGLALTSSGGNVTAIYMGGYNGGGDIIGGRVWKLVPTGGQFAVDTSYGSIATPGGADIDRSSVSEVDDLLLQGSAAVVAGYAQNGQNSYSCGIARVDPAGQPEVGFGAHIDVGSSCVARDLAVDGGGRFVFAGESYSGTQFSGSISAAIGRWTAAGQPDTAFAVGGGVAVTPGGAPAFGRGVLLQGSKPVIAGGAKSPHEIMLARFAGGDLPPATGGGGGGTPPAGGNTPTSAPFNIHVPGIVGATPPFKLGAQLACDPGTWGPQNPYTITGYRWYRFAFTATSIGAPKRVGEAQAYTVGPADQGNMLACAAIATNAKGSNIASSPRAAVRVRIRIPATIRRLSVEQAKAYLRRLFDGQVSFGTTAEQLRAGAPKRRIPCDFGGTHDEGDGCPADKEGRIKPNQVFNSTPAIGHFIDEAYGSGTLPKIVLDYYDSSQDKSDDVPRATPRVDCPASMGADVKDDFENRVLGKYAQYARDLLAKYNCPFSETTKYNDVQSVDPYVTEIQGASFSGEHGYRITVSAPKRYDLVAVVFHKPKSDVDSHGGNLVRGPRQPGFGEDGKLTALRKGNVKNDLCFHVIEVATGRGVPGVDIRAYAPNGSEAVDTSAVPDKITTDSDGDKCGSFSIHETGVFRFTMTYVGTNGGTEEGVLPLTAVDRGTKKWTTISGREMQCTVVDCAQLGFASSRRAHAANVLEDIGNFFRGILDRLTGHGSPIVNAANAAQAAQSDGGTGPTLYYAQANNGVTPGVLADKRGVKIISNDGGSIINNNGGSIISNDGGSIISDHGAGLSVKINGIISNDGGSLVALSQGGGVRPAVGGGTTVVAVRDGRIISNDGGSLLGDAGAAIISDNGGGIIGDAGASVLSDNGLGLVATNGGAVVMYGGKSVIANPSGVIPKGTLINDGAGYALPLSGFVSDQGAG
jgi:uncharacterized delta-60 repeat protein